MSQLTADSVQARSTAYHVRMTALVVLRMMVGWHFLYEGVSKLYTPGWSAEGYLMVSKWVFAPVFQWMASTPAVLATVNFLNVWGLVLIGLGLMFGALTRIAGVAGIVLLGLYYFANPPFIGMDFGVVTEGNYLFVDKNLVELIALAVIVLFPTGRYLGIDRLVTSFRVHKPAEPTPETVSLSGNGMPSDPAPGAEKDDAADSPRFPGRREWLKGLAGAPVFGVFTVAVLRKIGWESYEETRLQERQADAVTSATIKLFDFTSLKDLEGTAPHGRIGNLDLSRIILGGNLIGGWAHARDLIYVSKLVKAYHTRDKIFETFYLAEKCGINAFLTNPVLCGVINDYWRRDIGSLTFISDCGGNTLMEGVKKSIDNGAGACYVHGGMADSLAREGKFDQIAEAVEFIRANGLPAGIGGHDLKTVMGCAEYGISPDFWMKTFHPIDY